MLLYFNVSGGPFVSEDTIGNAGPLVGLLGLIAACLFYALPSAMFTAELSTAFPEDAGVVAWVTAAFGPKWGFTQGVLFWLNGAIALAPYPLMLIDYLRYAICPSPAGHSFSNHAASCDVLDNSLLPFLPSNEYLIIIIFVLGVSYLNYSGLKLVGSIASVFVMIVLLPFGILSITAIASSNFDAGIWFRDRPFGEPSMSDIKWFQLANSLVWIFNYFDSASTLAGEVENPSKTIPSALFATVGFAGCSYIIPLMCCVAALPSQTWSTGFWVQAGYELGGHYLQYWIFAASCFSFIGQFLAGQATVAYELLGMAELGQMPVIFMQRNSAGVPVLSLFISIAMVGLLLAICGKDLSAAMAISNGVYCMCEIVEYFAFLYLRWYHDGLKRPWRIPLGFTGCVFLLIPSFLLSVMMIVAPFFIGEWWVGLVIAIVICIGLGLHTLMSHIRVYYPDSFLKERQGQSEAEGMQVSLHTSGS